jgi:dTDP-glucose pyrophosphorylase
MAGRGTRFSNFGYTTPKPFIDINDKPMFIWALKSLEGLHITKLIIIVLEEHIIQYNLEFFLQKYCLYPYKIISLKSVTEGQLCTVMAAEPHVNNNENILIISSDTLVITEINNIINDDNSSADGIISTMISEIGNNWSFVKLDELGNVIEVAEKNRISNFISTGLYYFKSSKTFFKYAHQLIDLNIRVNGEFYIIPVYELLLKNNLKVKIANSLQMWDMGNPEAKKIFEEALNSGLINY